MCIAFKMWPACRCGLRSTRGKRPKDLVLAAVMVNSLQNARVWKELKTLRLRHNSVIRRVAISYIEDLETQENESDSVLNKGNLRRVLHI